jgi:hypothetical protein
MSSDGDWLVVGSRTTNDFHKGSVFLYYWDVSNYMFAYYIDSAVPDTTNSDGLGWSISISGDGTHLAIGSYTGGSENEGHVVAYKRAVTDVSLCREYSTRSAWLRSPCAFSEQPPDLYGDTTDDYLGWSVALSTDGSHMIAGAVQDPFNEDGDSMTGHGYVKIYQHTSRRRRLGQDVLGPAVRNLLKQNASHAA